LLDPRARAYPPTQCAHLTLVADKAKRHPAAAVVKWLAVHPRFALLSLPPYCPRANPIERAFGDGPDTCTRNPTRKRRRDLVDDVEPHLQVNGPWPSALSHLYSTAEVTAAGQALRAAETSQKAISQLAA